MKQLFALLITILLMSQICQAVPIDVERETADSWVLADSHEVSDWNWEEGSYDDDTSNGAYFTTPSASVWSVPICLNYDLPVSATKIKYYMHPAQIDFVTGVEVLVHYFDDDWQNVPISVGYDGWVEASFSENLVDQIRFRYYNDWHTPGNVSLREFQMWGTVIPEPATIGLLSLGMLSFVFKRRFPKSK